MTVFVPEMGRLKNDDGLAVFVVAAVSVLMTSLSYQGGGGTCGPVIGMMRANEDSQPGGVVSFVIPNHIKGANAFDRQGRRRLNQFARARIATFARVGDGEKSAA